MNLFRWKTLSFALLCAGVALFVLCAVFSLPDWALTALGVLALCAIMAFPVINLLFWHCPYCKKRLPWKELAREDLETCPFCGETLPSRSKEETPKA